MTSKSFNAVADNDARVLILGTLPGTKSLEEQQYYAKKTNSFWWIMGQLFGAVPEMEYSKRLEVLKKNRIALWDVIHSAKRAGSLDSDILFDTIVPNDFKTFLRKHNIELIAFNGQPARKFFCKLFPEFEALPHAVLPSTSPAHAGKTREQKLKQWREALSQVIDCTPAKKTVNG